MKKILLSIGLSGISFAASAQYAYSGASIYATLPTLTTSYTSYYSGSAGFPATAKTLYSNGGSAVTTFQPAPLPGYPSTATTVFSSGTTAYTTFRPAPLPGYPSTATTTWRR